MKHNKIISGALILTASNLVTRCMGFFNRVFLSGAIGAEGIGLYQLILPIYGLAWSITSAGITTTISSLTAQEHIRGENGNIGRIVKQSATISLVISLCISGILFFGAEEIASCLLKDARACHPLQLLSFAIPFMAVGSSFRGFFLGMQEAMIPALSQVLEQSARIISIYLLAGIFVPLGLSYACCAAVSGILVGELLSCGFTFYQYMHYKRKHHFLRRPTISSYNAFSMILSMAVPLSASRMISSLLSTAENLLIPRQLQLHGQNSTQALATYGELTGMVIPLILLPSACLTAVSLSLIPEISEACTVKQDARIRKTVSATFLFTSIVGVGAAALFSVFSREVCYIVYNRSSLGIVLFPMAFLCPFIYAQTTLHGLINGLGEQFFLFWNNIISSMVSIIVIWVFMPQYGLSAFLGGWFLSLLVSDLSSFYLLWKKTGAFPSVPDCFLKPVLAGTASGLLVKYLIRISEPSRMLFLFSLFLMGILYLFFLFLSGCLSLKKKDLLFIKK